MYYLIYSFIKGYDSIQILNVYELIICSGRCSNETVTGACVPLELRTGT